MEDFAKDFAPEEIHPVAKSRLDASEKLYLEEIARIRERLQPEYDALANIPDEEANWQLVLLAEKAEALMSQPMVDWMLRNSRIIE